MSDYKRSPRPVKLGKGYQVQWWADWLSKQWERGALGVNAPEDRERQAADRKLRERKEHGRA